MATPPRLQALWNMTDFRADAIWMSIVRQSFPENAVKNFKPLIELTAGTKRNSCQFQKRLRTTMF